MNNFGNYLKGLRKSKSKSIRKASEEIGISHTYLDSLEKGYDPRTKKERKPTPAVLGKVSKYYDVPYNKLLIMAGYFKGFGDLSTNESIDFIKDDLLLEDDNEINVTKLMIGVSAGKRLVLRQDEKLTHQESSVIAYLMNKLAEEFVERKEPLTPDEFDKIKTRIDKILSKEGD